MRSSKYRDMRILLFFDLPTQTSKDKKNYQQFRKFLLNDGYIMVQYSVYSRFCRNYQAIDKHKKRIMENKPEEGEVRFMVVTEKQYHAMIVINGEFNLHEKTISIDPLIEV